MKKYLSILLLAQILVITATAQIPSGYYDTAENYSGNELKTALYNIIKGHTEYPYTSSSTDVWDILKETDRDPANPNNVVLLYTGWSVNAAQEYNKGSGWSREHAWAKSRGNFGTSKGPGTDVHHLRPCDISVNSARNSRWFGNCTKPYYDGGVFTGCYTSSTEWVWMPREEVKGDVARMIFYMATRYLGENGEPDLEVIDYFPSYNYTKEPVHAKLSALLQWHKEDPVDDFERNRNEVVYSYQNNRNPFIDHPEWVEDIWGNQAPVIESIALNPLNPTDMDNVDILATISDDDGSIFEASLYWGYSSDDLTNKVSCKTTDGALWVGQIAAQLKNSTFYFQILAVDDKTDSTLSEVQSYTVEGSTGIFFNEPLSEIKVYPNPVIDVIFIDNPDSYVLSLFSMDGKKIRDLREGENIMRGSPSGTYLIRIEDRDKKIVTYKTLIKR